MESLSTPSPAGEDANDLQKFDLHKFPYHGRAPNLIDKFLIIGYDPKVLEKTDFPLLGSPKIPIILPFLSDFL